jgi:protein-tyrosine phosphatase
MIPNLRDVGETINILYGREVMRERVFFRGGTVNELFDASELPDVRCILNLRNGRDQQFAGVKQIHIPRTYTIDIYNTRNGQVRHWLNNAIASVASEDCLPLLVHCTGGKDRTGVFVALVLMVMGIEIDHIIEDYLLSVGGVDINLIKQAITGFGNVEDYLYNTQLLSLRPFLLTR